MEEIKFKIKNTESANVEIVPCEDGVEIIVKYGTKSASKETYKLHSGSKAQKKSNAEILKEFCGDLKDDPDVDLKELKAFFKFYEKKCPDWKGTMDCNKLWLRWQETAQ